MNKGYRTSVLSRILQRSLLAALFACIITSCGSHKHIGKGHKVSNHGRHTEIVIPSGLSKERLAIIKEAETWLGTPYVYAGAEKNRGTDCSGMVLRIYEDILGVKLPRNSAKQAEFCRKLKPKNVEPGDLVFFATGKDPDRISHVGIMVNDEEFIHASSSKGVVVSNVTTPYYQRTFKMYGRP